MFRDKPNNKPIKHRSEPYLVRLFRDRVKVRDGK